MGCVHMGPFQAIAKLEKRSITRRFRRILHPLDVSLVCFRFVDRSPSGGQGERERGGGERQYQQLNREEREGDSEEGGREETAAAIGFSLMLIERVTAVGDSHSVCLDAGVESRVSEEGADEDKGRDGYQMMMILILGPLICSKPGSK